LKKRSSILCSVLLVITFGMVIAMFVTRIQGTTPQLFGYQIFRISSPSMEPDLKVGDIILSERVKDVTELKKGDIITYRGELGSYSGKNITHEVIEEPYKANGKYHLQTMGIANTYADPQISESQVIGKMIRRMPVLSAIYSFFITPLGLVVMLAFLAFIFINEALSLRRLIKENKHSDSDTSESDE